MATTHLIPVGEYLGSTYRPDVDYVDGHIEERHLGDYPHGKLQFGLSYLFQLHQQEWAIRVVGEVRVKVSSTRFRIPDLCIHRAGVHHASVIEQAPLLCIEILSPRDTVTAMRARIQDYLTMGVPAVWILDPATRTAYVCSGDQMTEHHATDDHDGTLSLDGTPIHLAVRDIFAILDQP